uniref:Uncharacterized protein n=1 Tax=Octopus bimaculoides TaxID=37653 RepID=A0A0L8I1F5_OCTBM
MSNVTSLGNCFTKPFYNRFSVLPCTSLCVMAQMTAEKKRGSKIEMHKQ